MVIIKRAKTMYLFNPLWEVEFVPKVCVGLGKYGRTHTLHVYM